MGKRSLLKRLGALITSTSIIGSCGACKDLNKEKQGKDESKNEMSQKVSSQSESEQNETLPEVQVYSEAECDDKPIIYIYTDEPKDVRVNVTLNAGVFTCVYPDNKDTDCSVTWNVTAYPDGTLINKVDGMSLYSLYWEGINYNKADFSSGFCVRGKDTAEFLNSTLRELGLNDKETEEFIIYWLPRMHGNAYNIISFDTENYVKNTSLTINPAPDNLIRVFMTFKPSDEYVEIPQQVLDKTPSRDGYTVVEWGGTELSKGN